MTKNKANMSMFSTLVERINTQPSTAQYHLIDHEYFAAFNSLDEMQQFQNALTENQTIRDSEEEANALLIERLDTEVDMKAFAQQFLIDSRDSSKIHRDEDIFQGNQTRSTASSASKNQAQKRIVDDVNHEKYCKRQRRSGQDSSQSNSFSLASDDENENIFDSLIETKSSSRTKRIAYEDMSAILLTLDVKKPAKKKSKYEEPTITMEIAEPSLIKSEPIEQEQLVITHIIEPESKPVQVNVVSTIRMRFGTPECINDLDSYVQNIHRSCSTNVSISHPTSSRPKRIRKQKKFYIEESADSIVPRKRARKKRPQNSANSTLLTDAEIEQQFGERLLPAIELEQNDKPQSLAQDPIIIKAQPLPLTPVEKARAKLTDALERGHGPDKLLLKVCSRDNKVYEIELAIYSSTDWYCHRAKILSKIGETFSGLRVNWAKINIQVENFDIEISISFPSNIPTGSLSSANNTTASPWFLKLLSESGPLIVHIHDRRYPHQRYFVKCPCPQCSFNEPTTESSLPVIVSVSSLKATMSNRQLSPPTILRRVSPSKSSLQNINTKFFQDLICQHGTNTVSSVTQCVLDLALIVSVHASIPYLSTSSHNYQKCYQQIIDPLKYSLSDIKNQTVLQVSLQPDILTFYRTIKKHKANIRDAQSMRAVISESIPKPTVNPLHIIKSTSELVLPKPSVNRHSITMNRFNKRHRYQISTSGISNTNNTCNGMKRQAHFTPIIELKPILGGSTGTDDLSSSEPIRKSTKIISTNIIQKDSQRINMITTREITPRVIRLSINKSALPINSIRLVASTTGSSNSTVSTSLVPKQINIIKPLSSSIIPAIKLANPVLIFSKSQGP